MTSLALIILMPIIATVAGVKIYMYFNDHNPPHFHAKHGGKEDVFDLDGQLMDGELHPKKRKKVSTWAKENRSFLEGQWNKHKKK